MSLVVEMLDLRRLVGGQWFPDEFAMDNMSMLLVIILFYIVIFSRAVRVTFSRRVFGGSLWNGRRRYSTRMG